MARRVLRPRVLVYGAILLAIVAAGGLSLALRSPLKVDVIRDRGSLAREVEDGRIENVYRLQVMNTVERPQRFTLSVRGPAALGELELLAEPQPVQIAPVTTRAFAVRVRAQPGAERGLQQIEFTLATPDSRIVEKSRFIVP